MQLDPEIAYALGGPFTPDQVAIILSRADLTRPANDQLWALELAQLPEADRLAELGFPHPPQEDDHDADTCARTAPESDTYPTKPQPPQHHPKERTPTTMAGETIITVIGNLTADPELRFTPTGAAVSNFTVASTPRSFDKNTGEWKDGDALFLRCSLWRQPAENVAESLTRGSRVIVTGRLQQRSYETKEGEKRTVIELAVDEIGPSLRYATARVNKATRQDAAASRQGTAPADDPWGSAPAGGAGYTDEPPL